MPAKVKHVKGGYKAGDAAGKTFSKKPMTKKKATRQAQAINISMKKRGKAR